MGGFFAVNFVVAWVLLVLTAKWASGQSTALPLPQGGRITVEGVVRSPAGDTVGDTAVRTGQIHGEGGKAGNARSGFECV